MELDSADTAGYSLRRVLGSGPAGTAWLVRDRASGRNAVLKHLPIHAFTDPDRFRDDLKILERLRHPHLARLLEYRETGKAWILITEYAVAGSLEALLARRARLGHGELVTLLTPLAQALDHLHRAGLTHGALTPSNIAFDATGRPLLTDTALRPQTPTTDYQSLATIAHDTAADPTLFPQDLFVKTPPAELPRRLHAIAPPAPIDLATHKIQPLTDLPANRTATPPDDDTTELSLGPLDPPPPQQSAPPAPPPHPIQLPSRPTAAKSGPKRTRPWRRNQTRRGRLLRRLHHPDDDRSITFARSASPWSTTGFSTDPPEPRPPTAAPLPPAQPPADAKPLRGVRATLQHIKDNLLNRVPRRPAYGILAAAALGAVVVLIVAAGTLRLTANPPATADAAPNPRTSLPSTPTTPTNATTPSHATPTNPTPTSPTTRHLPTAGTQNTASPPPASTPGIPAGRAASPRPPGTAADAAVWMRWVGVLDGRRGQVFRLGDPAGLDAVYVRGSPPWTADLNLLNSYRAQNLRIQSLKIRLDSVRVVARANDTVTLEVTDHLVSGEVVDTNGISTPLPAGKPTARRITLTAPDWRISSIVSV